jgi:hypothetical protein
MQPISTIQLPQRKRVADTHFSQLPVSGWNIEPTTAATTSSFRTTSTPFSGLSISSANVHTGKSLPTRGKYEFTGHSLSIGAKAGIAIAIVLILISVAVRLAIVIWKKNQKDQEKEEEKDKAKGSGNNSDQKGKDLDQGKEDMTEFDGRDTISSRPGLQELDGVYGDVWGILGGENTQ